MSDDFQALSRPLPQWFANAVLGIFIHWGAYSVPGWAEPYAELGATDDEEAWFTHCAYAEWYANTIRIPGSPAAEHHRDYYGNIDYSAFADMWSAENFDAGQWMALFADAGADYVIPTSKHHDGITLWPAPEIGDYSTVARGPRRDLIAELATAARSANLRFGVYYSGGLDWHYRPYPPILSNADLLGRWRPVDLGYARYAALHLQDLVDRYQPDVLWNDIEWPDAGKHFGEFGLGQVLQNFRDGNPDGIINDRFGIGFSDFGTGEYQVASSAEAHGLPWEQCRGIGLSFGYNRDDSYASAADLAAELVDVVSRGGRLLLNVGPKADGTIPPEQADVLADLGSFMTYARAALSGGQPVSSVARAATDPLRLIGHPGHVVLAIPAGVAAVTAPPVAQWEHTQAVTPGVSVAASATELRITGSDRDFPVLVTAPR